MTLIFTLLCFQVSFSVAKYFQHTKISVQRPGSTYKQFIFRIETISKQIHRILIGLNDFPSTKWILEAWKWDSFSFYKSFFIKKVSEIIPTEKNILKRNKSIIALIGFNFFASLQS